MSRFAGRRVTLLGLARTNVALARFLVREGAHVTIADDKSEEQLRARIEQLSGLPVSFRLGGGGDPLEGAELLFVTPGVPRHNSLVRRAEERGIGVSSEIELLFELCPVPIAAITGSAGKTTTTTLAGEMLQRSGLPTFVGGNIGTPLIDRMDQMEADARVVLELSSFQLQPMRRSAHVGAILNVTPNHLDWDPRGVRAAHETFDEYRDAKANLIAYQGPSDAAVLGLDNSGSAALADRGQGRKLFFSIEQSVSEGAYLGGRELVLAVGETGGVICRRDDVLLRGEHNLRNILAASIVAALRGASLEAIRAVATTFSGVEHRIEPVRNIAGVPWFNDSKATSPDETIAALRSFDEPIVLLAGGRSKNAPLDDMAQEIAQRARVLVVFGEMADEIADSVAAASGGSAVETLRAPSLAGAVALARQAARPGDVVLLSPSGTSFDAFTDYEHRGRVFKQLVEALPDEENAR